MSAWRGACMRGTSARDRAAGSQPAAPTLVSALRARAKKRVETSLDPAGKSACATRLVIAIVVALAVAAQEPERPEIQIQKVVAGLTFTEGPVWSRDGFLYFSEIPANRILQFVPGKGLVVFRENSNGANGNALDAQGRLYTCEGHQRRVTRTDRKGKIEVLAERYQGKRLNSPNDIVVRKDGNVYFTDPAFGSSDDKRELDFYGVYRITTKGVLEVVAKPKGRPNGIALSPNGRILYVTNSEERNIRT